MSTRGNVIYRKNKEIEIIYYSHTDSYPSGLGEDLKEVLDVVTKNNTQSSFTHTLTHKLPYIEQCNRVHGDIDYLYVIDETKSDFVFRSFKYDMFNDEPDYLAKLINLTEPLEKIIYTKDYKFDRLSRDRYHEILSEYKHIIENIGSKANETHIAVNQTYSTRELPYFVHLEAVVMAIKRFAYFITMNEEDVVPVIFGGYFHDSIEDARLNYSDVKKIALDCGLSEEQATLGADIVYALTNEKGKTRAERANDKYYAGIRKTKYASFVKLCDRYANIFYCALNKEDDELSKKKYDMYKKEMDSFIMKIENPYTSELEYMIPEELKKETLKL